jgi:hypothetical protein
MSGRTSGAMARSVAIILTKLAMAAVGLLIVLSLLYFVHGSFEMYPTDERQSGIGLVTGTFTIILTTAEVCLWMLLRLLKKKCPSFAG